MAEDDSANKVRVEVFLNGSGSGPAKRVVLNRTWTWNQCLRSLGSKFSTGASMDLSAAVVYTNTGIAVTDVDEISNLEILHFDPRGSPFAATSGYFSFPCLSLG